MGDNEAIIQAADAYARAFREHAYGDIPRLKRNALKEAIRAAHREAVEESVRLREENRELQDEVDRLTSGMRGAERLLDHADLRAIPDVMHALDAIRTATGGE